MSKETRITVDGATVKTKGQDLFVSPKRLRMFLVAIILGGFGVLLLLVASQSMMMNITEGEWSELFEMLLMIILAVGLIGVAYFAFNTGKNQQPVHFDAHRHHVQIGKETVPFDQITGVYLCHMKNMTLGDISSVIIETGITSNSKTMPIASVSNNRVEAVKLIRLYTKHLGHDPDVLGSYDNLVDVTLHPKLPVELPFKAQT